MELLTIDKKIKSYADNNPSKIAVRHGNEEITYKQLEEHSNRIADFLIDNFTKSKNVFVVMDKGIELIEALVGVIKSSGIFVPIDYKASDNRTIKSMNELKPGWIITTNELLDRVHEFINSVDFNLNVLVLGDYNKNKEFNGTEIYTLNDYKENENKTYEYCQNKHCYIYFTSGSTGSPKAVLGRHRSLMQFIEWETNEFKINDTYNVSQLTPITFDPFLRDVFLPLCSGGTLCIPRDKEIILNPNKLIEWIEENEISLIHMVPSLFRRISRELQSNSRLKNLRYIMLAGELLRGNDVKKFIETFGERVQLVNLYGPTETTLAKFFYRLKESDINKDIIPVGKPIDFCQAYIVDKDLNQCPQEVIGELYIRTPYISSGYCNDKEKTREVFKRNFFSQIPNDIIYKTGDLGRRLADGNIELVGRMDDQVKVRGMRIELGEVENSMLKLEGIKEIKVIAKEDEEKNKSLWAYFIANKSYTVHDLRLKLKSLIPEHMIPDYFVEVESMPLNANGKINKKELSKVKGKILTGAEYEAPRNNVEGDLLEIWQHVLGDSNIGINEDFFEAGGHSLKVMSIITMALEKGYKLNINNVYSYPTVKELSNFIINNATISYSVNTNEEFQEFIKSLKLQAFIKNISADEREIKALIINEIPDERKKEIIKKISVEVNPSIQPQYIKFTDDINKYNNATDAQISECIFNKKDKNLLLETFKENFKQSLDYNFHYLTDSSKVKEYEISGTQNIRLSNPEYVVVTINVGNSADIYEIKKALLTVINEQGLLKSRLEYRQATERYYWNEYQEQTDIDVPVIDLQDLYPADTDNISRDILSVMMKTDEFIRKDKPLFRTALIKQNFIDNILVIAIDHIICDGFSAQVMKSRVKELLASRDKTQKESLQFSDYLEMLSKGPVKVTEDEIIKKFKLNDFKLSLNKINNLVKEHNSLEKSNISMNLDYSKDNNADLFEQSLEVLLDILEKYLGISRVPMVLINYGRKYGEYDYYNVVGELIDYIPFELDINNKNIKDYMSEKFKFVSEHNINFAQLIYDQNLRNKYKKITNLLNNLFESSFVVFNFQRVEEKSEFRIKEALIDEENETINNMNSIMFNVKVTDSSIKVQLSLPFKIKSESEIISLISEKFKED